MKTFKYTLVGIFILAVCALVVPGSSGASAPYVAPELVNVATAGHASQSSINRGHAAAERAIDGNTDGNYRAGSVTHTEREAHPWWQVELPNTYEVAQIRVWNRTDCCAQRLNNFWVLTSAEPFASDDLEILLDDPAVTAHHVTQAPQPSLDILPVPHTLPGANANGAGTKYVRIQLATTNYLSLAEVEVLAAAPDGMIATQSSTHPSGADATRAIDGNTDGNFRHGSVTHTARGDNSPWWNVEFAEPRPLLDVVVWNRTDCCGKRLDGVIIDVSEEPGNACSLTDHAIPSPWTGDAITRRYRVADDPSAPRMIRSVCIRKFLPYLSLAEVEFRDATIITPDAD